MSAGGFLRGRLKSFAHALAGLGHVLRSQPNAWIHAIASLLVVALGLFLGVERMAWCWLVVAMALVWIAEAANTALEALADAAVPDAHPLVGRAKDSAAGAVLCAAVAAAVIGVLVLGPPLLAWLSA